MVIAVQVIISDKEVRYLLKKFTGPSVKKYCTYANHKTAEILRDRMFNIWVNNYKANSENRMKHKRGFRVIKDEKNASVYVTVPMQAYWMDVLQRPRAFSIRGKPRMKRWLNTTFLSSYVRRTGYSRIHFEHGKAKYGHLDVHPSPFSEKAILSIRKEHKHYIGQVVKNIIKGGV